MPFINSTWRVASLLLLCLQEPLGQALQVAKAPVHDARLSASFKPETVRRAVSLVEGLAPRQIDYCQGTCKECYGDEYVKCPDSILCYIPNDPRHSCDPSGGGGGGGGGGGDSSPTPSPTPTGTSPGGSLDFCSGVGATCESCFGEGFVLCPGSSSKCYNPDEPRSTCDGGGGGGGGGGGDDDDDEDDDDDTPAPSPTPSATSSESSSNEPSLPTPTIPTPTMSDLPDVPEFTGGANTGRASALAYGLPLLGAGFLGLL